MWGAKTGEVVKMAICGTGIQVNLSNTIISNSSGVGAGRVYGPGAPAEV